MSILSVKNLTKSYKKGTPVLSGLNIEIMPGKIVGLLGPNGCGKSTLMKLVSGLLQPDGGEILVDGKNKGNRFISSRAYIFYLRNEGKGSCRLF